MHHAYSRQIPIPLRLQPSIPPTEVEITSRQDAWCKWVWQHEYDPYKTDRTPILRAVPQWNDDGAQIPTEEQIYNLLVNYTRKMNPEDVPLIADNPDLKGYKVRKFSSSRFNVHYLLMKATPGRSGIPKEDAEPIRLCESTCWPATKTKHSSYDRLIRIKMPWAPYYGVENEVANMLFAAQHSKIRIPDIYCFDSSGNNTLGLDFIIMERIPGLCGSDVIESPGGPGIRGEDRRIICSLTAQFRDRTNGLYKRRFDTIGSLYCRWDTETPACSPSGSRCLPELFVGPLVARAFFGPMLSKKSIDLITADREVDVTLLRNLKFSRGPFLNTKGYLKSLINAHLLRDWSQCKPSAQQRQQNTKNKGPMKMTAISLSIALGEATSLYTDMGTIMGLPKKGNTKLSTPYLFGPRFSPSDLRPGSLVVTEQASICTSSPEDSTRRESKSWKWYRLGAVTEWDTVKIMPYILSRHAFRNGYGGIQHEADSFTESDLTDRPNTFVHMLSRLSLDRVHEGDVQGDDSMECARRLRGLENEIGWLCAVEVPKLQEEDIGFI